MPAFGFAVGFISDYIALNMLFRPVQPTTYLRFIRFQGLLHAQRDKITRDYAKILADDLFSPEILFDGVIKGPGSDKLFALAAKEVDSAIDARPASSAHSSCWPWIRSATARSRTGW
jgi:uncharacterized membrane protein YheB (UPF0754 family)